jgi:hypothetical protein
MKTLHKRGAVTSPFDTPTEYQLWGMDEPPRRRRTRLRWFSARRWLSLRVKHLGERLSWWIWP